MTSWLHASHICSIFAAFFWTDLNPVYYLHVSLPNVTTVYLHCIPLSVMFLTALFSVLYFSSCTPLLSVLLSPLFQPPPLSRWQSTVLLLSPTWLTQTLVTFKMLHSRSLHGWLPICELSTHTEFLLIGLSEQLAKILNSPLTKHHPLCSQSLCWTLFLFRLDLVTL